MVAGARGFLCVYQSGKRVQKVTIIDSRQDTMENQLNAFISVCFEKCSRSFSTVNPPPKDESLTTLFFGSYVRPYGGESVLLYFLKEFLYFILTFYSSYYVNFKYQIISLPNLTRSFRKIVKSKGTQLFVSQMFQKSVKICACGGLLKA